MAEAVKSLWNLSQDEKMREYVEAMEKQKMDQASYIQSAEERGMKKGREEGLEKGREEGLQEGIRQVAQNMLAAGAGPKFVAKSTGLSLKEIEKLQKK